ncbi:hypothetical protein QQF64_000942 [Cirrhinus molitorella]|uniref:Uncharacterized protein n=1 Tax=Cirrhinus molitorella TaxID=172907 RepID=A0ABR3NZ04_9TELE
MLGWRNGREGADQANPHLKQTGANCWEAQLFINGRHSGEEEQIQKRDKERKRQGGTEAASVCAIFTVQCQCVPMDGDNVGMEQKKGGVWRARAEREIAGGMDDGSSPSADSKKSLMQPEVGIKALEMRKEDKTAERGSSETMMRVGLNAALP